MTSSGAHLLTVFLAAPPTPPPGKGAEWGKAAPIGLLILVLLGIALYLLIKSMNKHMRKVGAVTSFEAVSEVSGVSADATAATATAVPPTATVLTDDADRDPGTNAPTPR